MTDASTKNVLAAAQAAQSLAGLPLATTVVEIDGDCTGVRWSAKDQAQLARFIAIIAMGQAAYSAEVIQELVPAAPAFTTKGLKQEAITKLTVQKGKQQPRTGYPRWHRDGFMFEAISWIAARQDHGKRVLLTDPHMSATSQGIDGLMIRLSKNGKRIVDTVILEDKCSKDPRTTFLQAVIPTFLEYHTGKRGAEVVAAASVLMRMAGFGSAEAATQAAAVTDRDRRSYRAAFALTEEYDSLKQRQYLFKDYNQVEGIRAKQRIGASFIVTGGLRDWFDILASQAVEFINGLEDGDV